MTVILSIKEEDKKTIKLKMLDTITIGRSSSCEFKTYDEKVSGRHCTFELSNGKIYLTDLGSTNGSFLNNSQIEKTIVLINDIVKIGNTIITIDEEHLTASEKKSIGTCPIKKSEAMTLPKVPLIEDKEIKASKEKTQTNAAQNVSNRKRMEEIEPEPSSGLTKALELTTIKSTKKRRPKLIRSQ